jgi:hypothetical protein
VLVQTNAQHEGVCRWTRGPEAKNVNSDAKVEKQELEFGLGLLFLPVDYESSRFIKPYGNGYTVKYVH